MKRILLSFLLIYVTAGAFSQVSSPDCITATPICGGTANSYPSTSGAGNADFGPNFGCLGTQPNPAWFYFKIDNPGNLIINISQLDGAGTGLDVDFICWGPFTTPSSGCSSGLTGSAVDCSYSTSFMETVNVPGAISGDYYILMITNFSNIPATVTFSFDAASTATVTCSDVCVTNAFYNAPLCVNGTLQLLSTYHFGLGNYNWTGPSGFSSTLQNPTISTVDGTNSGYYYLNYIKDTTCNYTDSVYVDIDTCGTLTGSVFADVNSDCLLDTADNLLENVPMKLTQGGVFVAWAWTDPFGYYYFDVPVGSYDLEVNPSPTHPIVCPSSMMHAVTVSSSAIATENFAIDCNAFDLHAVGFSVSGLAFFPGQTNTLHPAHNSIGPNCNPIPGQVIIVIDPLISYVGPTVGFTPPDMVIPAATGDTLKWNVADMTNSPYFSYSNFPFEYITDISATIGDTVHVTMILTPQTGDSNPLNNVCSRDFVVGNSYDPNHKDVIPAGIGSQGFIPVNTPELSYTVNFQNTGTAPAINVYLMDTLDTQVDITSLRIIGSSHPMTTTLLAGNVLKFNFANIMLADSTSNEPESHGFVKYSIAPLAGLLPGDQITNTAYIYFDFNSPIVTNTALNTIEFPVSVDENSGFQLNIYPNPANSIVTVSFEDKASRSLKMKIVNMAGQIVYEEENNQFTGSYNKSLDLKNNPAGVYILQIQTDNQTVHKKIIRN
ncbi:MAG: T9SS type A sorting domain-containing protein [Bacteroidota bacterium]|nr:T9SS type A sorting domain-containing protein [Bacteroidota bacterium]